MARRVCWFTRMHRWNPRDAVIELRRAAEQSCGSWGRLAADLGVSQGAARKICAQHGIALGEKPRMIETEVDAMAFRYNTLGRLVSEEPDHAADLLVRQIKEHDGNLAAVAEANDVNYTTLWRWINRLPRASELRKTALDARARVE